MEMQEVKAHESAVFVLVVEDEPLIRFDVSDALRALPDVIVIEARTADEAWQYLQTNGPVDFVFTDHRMPGVLTGAQLALKVRQDYPNTAVLVTSAHFDDTEWSEPILDKPYDAEHIAAHIVGLARRKG
jgi:DNA-binding NarL/FixJ family response regulator